MEGFRVGGWPGVTYRNLKHNLSIMEYNGNSWRAEVYHVCKSPDTQMYANAPSFQERKFRGMCI